MRSAAGRADVGGEHERPEPDGGPGERIGAALLAVDDADRGRDAEAGLPERLDRVERRAARGDDVLDRQTQLPRPRRRPRSGSPVP